MSHEIVSLNHLTPELPQHGIPRSAAPRHNVISNSFFFKFPSQYFGFTGINQRPAGRYFGLTGICNVCEASFLALRGERVNSVSTYNHDDIYGAVIMA